MIIGLTWHDTIRDIAGDNHGVQSADASALVLGKNENSRNGFKTIILREICGRILKLAEI